MSTDLSSPDPLDITLPPKRPVGWRRLIKTVATHLILSASAGVNKTSLLEIPGSSQKTNFPSGEPQPVPDNLPSPRLVASLWRRSAAYVIDDILLGVVGGALGTWLADTFANLGLWALLIGFGITLGYFAVMDSKLGNGQTFGKRWLRLRVIEAYGETISFPKSLLRSLIFVVPCFLFGIKLPESRTPWIVSSLLFVVVWWIGGSTLYLITFNRKTRQGLHDLAVRSYVANADDQGTVETQSSWNQWVILAVLLVIVSAVTGIVNLKLQSLPPFPEMRKDAGLIEQMEGVQRATLRDMLIHDSRSGGVKKNLFVSVTLRSATSNQVVFVTKVARTILENDRNTRDYDQLSVRLFHGYDIGINSHWNSEDFAHTPAEWEKSAVGALPAESSSPTHK